MQMSYLPQFLLESAAFSTLSARKGNFDQSSPVYSRLLAAKRLVLSQDGIHKMFTIYYYII